VAHARHTYPRPRFVRGNLAALPVRTAGFDVLATLQVIEHVWDHAQFVRECRRAVRPGGRLLVTTPNRLTFSPGRDEPVNPFHTKEFTAAELAALLTRGRFTVEQVFGLHAGPRLAALDAAHGGSFVDAQLAAAPERWSARLRDDVAAVTADDFEIVSADERDVDASLDLVLLARPDG
jgi:SAM-dependent methyltransferase